MKSRIVFVVMFLLTAVALFWHSTGCKKNPVAPEWNPRALTWSVDTLSHPENFQSSIYAIWGSSARDVYAAGVTPSSSGILWRYDGERWSEIILDAARGGPLVGAVNLHDVYGFGPDNVWAVGYRIRADIHPPHDLIYSSIVVHYDGVSWQKVPTPDGHILNTIWGASPDNIWMAGYNTLFHYDGSTINKDSIPFVVSGDEAPYLSIVSLVGTEDETFMLLTDFRPLPWQHYFLERRDGKWTVLDSVLFDRNHLWMSPGARLYAAGDAILTYNGSGWTEIFSGKQMYITAGIHGTSDDHFYAVGTLGASGTYSGSVHHYDGDDWFFFENLAMPKVNFIQVWTDGREVFITGRPDSPNSIIVHGK